MIPKCDLCGREANDLSVFHLGGQEIVQMCQQCLTDGSVSVSYHPAVGMYFSKQASESAKQPYHVYRAELTEQNVVRLGGKPEKFMHGRL